MATYKCDYDSIYDLAEKTRRDANDLESQSKTSNQERNAQLSSWSGDASTEFKDNSDQLDKDTQAVAGVMRAYADHLDEIADTVKEADEYCATAKI